MRAPVDVYARSRELFVDLPDTNNNPKISGAKTLRARDIFLYTDRSVHADYIPSAI